MQDSENVYYQLFSLSQNKNDGSIYLGSTDFTNFEWLGFEIKNGSLETIKFSQDNDGHLTFHGSGQAHVKDEDEPYKLPVNGNQLLNIKGNEIGFRHLFTFFPKQLTQVSYQQTSGRKTDQVIKSSKPLKPFVIVAFACPKGFDVEMMISFNMDDLESVPGDILGGLMFPLDHHNIWMTFYRTKNMNDWPKKNMLQYSDGLAVPMFIGKPERKIYVEFRLPSFNLEDNKLKVELKGAETANPSA